MVLPLLASCVQQDIARSRVKTALVSAGLPPATSQCMAHHMVDQLTVAQLRKLKALKGPKRTVDDYLAAVDRVGDPHVVSVAIRSAGLCAKG